MIGRHNAASISSLMPFVSVINAMPGDFAFYIILLSVHCGKFNEYPNKRSVLYERESLKQVVMALVIYFLPVE